MRALVTAAAIFVSLAHASAADPPTKEKDDPVPAGKLANPAYKSWAKFPKGTAVTLKAVSDTNGMKAESTMTLTLLELTPDKAVIEMVNVVTTGGTEFKSPPAKQELKRYVDAPPGTKPGETKKPEGLVEQGEKKVTVAGKEYKATYTKMKLSTGGVDVVAEAWSSDDVPGMVLKSVNTMSGAVSSATTLELAEIKKPDAKK